MHEIRSSCQNYKINIDDTSSFTIKWAVVVAQLIERSLLRPEIRGSNPVIGKILSTKLSANCIIEKPKIKKKRLGMAHL